MGTSHTTNVSLLSNSDDFSPAYGSEKEAWRDREGYCTYEESCQLIEDAAKRLVLVEAND